MLKFDKRIAARCKTVAFTFALIVALPLLAQAAVFNFTDQERKIFISFLFEPGGWLASVVAVSGQTALDVYNTNNNADILQWVRDEPQQDMPTALEMAMVWWSWKNDGIQHSIAELPDESVGWVSILDGYMSSIEAGLANTSRNNRDAQSAQQLYVRSGELELMPSGTHLVTQHSAYAKLRAIFALK